MKHITRLVSVFLTLVMVFSFAALSVQAQDATATPEGETLPEGQPAGVVCDSSLMLLVGLAQRDYGFVPPVDTTQFEHGQYAPYFDMNMEPMATEEMMPTEEVGTAPTLETPATDLMDIILLIPPLITDEDLRCTELRLSVEQFFATDRHPVGHSGVEMMETPAG